MWIYRFKVKVHLPFPIDMLRYDECFPASQDDSAKMSSDSGVKEISLIHYHSSKYWNPTILRWRSFTCEVIEIEKPLKL